MNDHRKLKVQGQAQLSPEHLLLDIGRREIIVVVEADLADRTRRRCPSDLLSNGIGRAPGRRSKSMSGVRMYADRHSHLWPQPEQPLRLRVFSLVSRRENDQCRPHAAGACARNDVGKIRRKNSVS